MALHADLNTLLRDIADDGPGCALGVVSDGQLQGVAVRGLANVEHRVPVAPDTVFHVASVSKQFAAYACAVLSERGELDLDAAVASILNYFPFEAVTTRHLIHHVSGMRDQWTMLVLAGRQHEDAITSAEILRFVARQRDLNFTPGSNHMYSNTGYTLLGEIVERITGLSLRRFCAREIFEPLGMTKTVFLDDHHEVIPNRADSYYASQDDGGVRRLALSYSTCGATSLNTTVPDLARWALYAMSPEPRRLLEQRITLNDGSPLDYATGIMLGKHCGRAVIEHSGDDAGFRAHLVMFPDDGVAGIALSNLSSCPVYDLAYAAAELVLNAAPAPCKETTTWSPPSETLAVLEGLYLDPASGETWTLVTDGERITLGAMELEPTRPSVFGLGGFVELQVEPDVRLRMVGALDRPLKRVDRWCPAPAELDRFTGQFWSDELETGWTIGRNAEGLALEKVRWGSLRMTPTVKNGFSASIPTPVFDAKLDVLFDDDGGQLAATTRGITRLRLRRV